jgi:hypothetical protein
VRRDPAEEDRLLTMAHDPRKMSEIMKEMAERLLKRPEQPASPEATQVALFFANVAWNECVGLDHGRGGHRKVWELIEADNPTLWSELKSNDIEAMIDELVLYKKSRYPDDRRRILACGMPDGKVHVEWLPAATPGTDVKWEMRLYGLIRTGEKEGAIRFLQETLGSSRSQAAKRVAEISTELGLS